MNRKKGTKIDYSTSIEIYCGSVRKKSNHNPDNIYMFKVNNSNTRS